VTTPTLHQNTITNNTESGIVFEGSFSGAVFPNLGNVTLSPPGNGQNSIMGNTHSTYAGANIVMNLGTNPGITIPAQNNWWGTANATIIASTIVDGNNSLLGPTYPVILFSPFSAVP
jgi:hypothetical protein